MTEENMHYLRNANLSCDSSQTVLEAVGKIPGYSVKAVTGTRWPDRTHLIKTPSGDEIHLVNGADAQHASTSNVMRQDQRAGRLPVQDDELVKLAKAAKQVDGLSITVTMSDDDLNAIN